MITTDDYNDDTASKNTRCNKTNHSSLGKEPNSKVNITTVAMMEIHIYIYIITTIIVAERGTEGLEKVFTNEKYYLPTTVII